MDSPAPDSPSLRLARRIALPFGLIEDWLGFLFANLLTLSIAGYLVFMRDYIWTDGQLNLAAKLVYVIFVLAWLGLDVPYLFRLWRSLFRRGRHPALRTAEAEPLWPHLLRPLVAFWWLTHFLIGVLAVFGFHLMAKKHDRADEKLSFFMATCCGYAANGYLILAIAAMTRSQQIRRQFWQCRVLLDLLLGVLGWLLAR